MTVSLFFYVIQYKVDIYNRKKEKFFARVYKYDK